MIISAFILIYIKSNPTIDPKAEQIIAGNCVRYNQPKTHHYGNHFNVTHSHRAD